MKTKQLLLACLSLFLFASCGESEYVDDSKIFLDARALCELPLPVEESQFSIIITQDRFDTATPTEAYYHYGMGSIVRSRDKCALTQVNDSVYKTEHMTIVHSKSNTREFRVTVSANANDDVRQFGIFLYNPGAFGDGSLVVFGQKGQVIGNL